MRLTLIGWKAAAFYLAMLLAYWASPYSNVFFLLVSFLTLQWVLCGFWSWRLGRGWQASIEGSTWIPSGSGTLGVRLNNGGGRSYRVTLAALLEGDGRKHRHTVTLPSLAGAQQAPVPLDSLGRGVYEVRGLELSSPFPLGYLERRRRFPARGEVVVYPAPGEFVSPDGSPWGGDDAAELGEGSVQPSGLREFRTGDSLRHIHWKASARRARPVIREWEGASCEEWEVLLDRRCAAQELEEALASVSLIVQRAQLEKRLVTLQSQGLRATYGEGQLPWSEALRFLATANPLPLEATGLEAASPGALRLPQASSILGSRTERRVG